MGATTLYDMMITGIYLGITTHSHLMMDDGEADDEVGMQTSPAELQAVARELVEYTRAPAIYEGWCYGGGLAGEYELSVEGLLKITVGDDEDDDAVNVTIDVDNSADALGLAVMLLDAAEALEG